MSGERHDCFLLVHPERFPSNDWYAVCGGGDPAALGSGDDFDAWYGAQVSAAAARASRRLVLLDAYALDDLDAGDEQLTVGVAAAGWTVVACEPHEIDHLDGAQLGLQPGARLLLAGFHRDDCVARAARRLRALGLEVGIDDAATLPLAAGS